MSIRLLYLIEYRPKSHFHKIDISQSFELSGVILKLLQDILSHSRLNSRQVLFLITDGFSNGGDPRNVAKALKSDGVTVFTFGVHNGNTAELFDMASTPGEEHSFILDSFDEFVALARRALHRGEKGSLKTFVKSRPTSQNLKAGACPRD